MMFTMISCADYKHQPCHFSGDGFTRKDNCGLSMRCVSDVPRVLDDGEMLHTPIKESNYRCSGPRCSSDDDCRADYFCYQDQSRLTHCMPKDPRNSVFLECSSDLDCCQESQGAGCYVDCTCQSEGMMSFCEASR